MKCASSHEKTCASSNVYTRATLMKRSASRLMKEQVKISVSRLMKKIGMGHRNGKRTVCDVCVLVCC